MLIDIFEKIHNHYKRKYYKKLLERNCGHKLPNVTVLGEIRIEACKLEICDNVILYPRVTFSGSGHIKIGRGSKIGQDCIIYASSDGGVTIGDNTIIAAQTYIIDSNHNIAVNIEIVEQGLISSPIMIGNDVWIGANCSIIKGAKIEDHAVIGAKSLVNSIITEKSIAFGIPAKIHAIRT